MTENKSAWTDKELLDVLRFVDDNLTYPQIGAIMGRTVGQVQGMIRRIRKDLAKSER